MLKSILLAGVFLAVSNLTPAGVPNAQAAPKAPAARTAVKHSSQSLAPVTHGGSVRVATPLPALTPASAAGILRPQEAEFVQRINAERTSRGLNALVVDPLLIKIARGHSQEMCDRNYFDHQSPSEGQTTPMDRYLKGLHDNGLNTPAYLLVGENIYYCSAFNSTYNVAYGHQALMNSPGHRANILENRFDRVGVGIYQDARGQFWVTEMFLRDTE